ncbi:HNH endonuclease [Listeria weihenstephanensis]|uniref:HNH endonuclease n=2 Tax=Listeria weihenstephanensis TaxID=1006155 RepID=A0A841Z9N7_9LIST|nr:HNH endonuclease [Listeria weihenstephanensis]
MVAGFGLNKILKNASKISQVDELSTIKNGTPDELARMNNTYSFENELPPLENGPYIKNGKPNGRPTLSGNAKSEFEQAVYNRQVSPDSKLRDPNPPHEIIDWKSGNPRKGVVDFGHLQGESYNDMFLKYKNRKITLDELKEFQFNPDNFQIEIPSKNRGHKFE